MVDDRIAPLPLVSVALCTYNGAAYLGEQLESLLAQTWPRVEIVAVDDASSDATWDILQRFAASNPKLRIERNPCNLGFSANFERTMALCSGDFIAPCDQDDVWLPHKLERLCAAIGSHTLAYCDSVLIDGQGRPLGARISDRLHMVEGSDPLALAFWNCISGHAMLFRRALLAQALPLRGVHFHDWWLAFVAASVGSIKYVDEPLVAYRQHGSSQTDVLRMRAKRDDSLSKAKERVDWLGALARLPSPHQDLFVSMHRLALARQDQWFCPQWWRWLRGHARRLMAINQRESFTRFALKQFFGMKWRGSSRVAP